MCVVQTAADELDELQRDMADLDQLRRELGQYFCEDETTFKLDDCIKTFSAFFDSFLKAIQVSQQVYCFLPRDAMHSAACAVVRCLSVRLPVTFMYCVETSKVIFQTFSPSGSLIIQVFPYQTLWQYSYEDPPARRRMKVEYENIAIFYQQITLSQK